MKMRDRSALLPKRIMVVAPHPDDEVIGCGGLLAKANRLGCATHVFTLYSPDQVRRRELADACHILGATHEVAYDDSPFLDHAAPHDIVGALDRAFAQFEPDLVAIPSPAGYHHEHRRIAELAVSATRPQGGRSVGYGPASVWYYEAPADISGPSGAASPTILVELTETDLHRKLQALAAHASQMLPAPSERSLDALDALARLRGCQIGVEYAEAFTPRRMVL